MLFLIFVAVSTNAQRIVAQPDLLLVAFLVQAVFYLFTFSLSLGIGRRFFDARDTFALVFSVSLRSLTVSMGLAAAAFGPNVALMVTLAIPLQSQLAAWLVRLNERWRGLSV